MVWWMVLAIIVAVLLGGLFVIFLAAFSGALVAARRHKRGEAQPIGAPAVDGSPHVPPPIRTEPVASPQTGSCPVCGMELPPDTPQGLCPQCLMQCVLSQSDHGVAEGKEGRTTPYPNLPSVPTPAELAPLFPDLEILQVLGQGGMGAVYKARQRKLDRLVAIKVLPAEWGRDPAFAERFAREARALARLNHPEIVSVHDFGEAGGHYFLLMEFVDGANLRQLLATGRLQPRQALPIVAQICEALQYAHEQGVVHRDIKPENILLDKRGRVKIADFGLAKLLRRSQNEFTLTGSRQVMGTLDYMAPEQRTKPQDVDHRADIYSLGVVFYEMLTGELPLGRFAPPSEKVAVDGRLDDVIFRALEREPDRRYQRISAIKADVELIQRAESWVPAARPKQGKVRGFLLSVFSVFASRPEINLPPIDQEKPLPGKQAKQTSVAEVSPAPGSSKIGKRRMRHVWLALAIAVPVCLLFAVIPMTWVSLNIAPEHGATLLSIASEDALEGLTVGNLDELRFTLNLTPNQLSNLKEILQGASREYLEMEKRHTSRQFDNTGHLKVTINPFAEEASQLEDRTWSKLNGILVYGLQQQNAKGQLPARGAMFDFGKEEVHLEIWRDDPLVTSGPGAHRFPLYHWKVVRNAVAIKTGPTESGDGPELPRSYQRFWHAGLPSPPG